MRLYIANAILNETIQPMTTADHTLSEGTDTIKRKANGTEGMDTETSAKRWKLTDADDTGKKTAEKVGITRGRRSTRIKKRNTGGTTRPPDIATDGKSETTGHASRDMESVQNDGTYLSSEANELATTHREQTDNNTLHRMTARVRRPEEAALSSLDQEQEAARTMRYASEVPSKRRRLSGKDIDSPDAFEDAEAAAGVGEAATSGGDCSSRESPSVKDIV